MNINLISYGNEKYAFQREFFTRNALASGFFDTLTVFNPGDLDSDFKEQYKDILSISRGAGYWIWKPYLVKKMLESLPDGDILIYCDSGCIINRRAKKRFRDYINVLINSETDSLGFELNHQEEDYTKAEVFDYLNSSELMKQSKQLIGGILFFQKSLRSIKLVERWNELLKLEPLLFTDEFNPEMQSPDFKGHRHDQSIFSLIRKTYGTAIIKDETYFDDFVREGQPYPIWATRLTG